MGVIIKKFGEWLAKAFWKSATQKAATIGGIALVGAALVTTLLPRAQTLAELAQAKAALIEAMAKVNTSQPGDQEVYNDLRARVKEIDKQMEEK